MMAFLIVRAQFEIQISRHFCWRENLNSFVDEERSDDEGYCAEYGIIESPQRCRKEAFNIV